MSALPTIEETINIGKGTVSLMAVDQQKGALKGVRLVKKASPLLISMVTSALEWGNESFPSVSEVRATATITITDLGTTGDAIEVFVDDPELGLISLGSYQKQSSDTTTTILAASIAAALNGNYGYGFSSDSNVITVTARVGTGASMDIGNRLSVEITPNPNQIPTDGLWGWYLSDTGVTGTTSVSAWADQSGGGNDLLQATANRQPALYEDILNGYPVVGLKAVVGTQARMTTISNFPFVDGATIFMVASQNTNGGNADVNGTYLEYAQDSIVFRDFTSESVYLTINSDSGAYLTPVTNGTYYTIALKTDGVDIYPYLNGVLGSPSGTSLTATQQPLYIFQNHLNANTGNKRFAEILVYTRVLTDEEMTTVFSYLKTKYNHY